MRELQVFGYRVVVSSSCEHAGALTWESDVDVADLVVIRKPNLGYDFGSWSVALSMLPEIGFAERVILANDSMAGPFASLRPLLEQFDATPVDVWGLTDTQQFGRHLQSYFLGFRRGVLAERPLRDFFADVRHEGHKNEIIHRYEIGLGRLLRAEAFVQTQAFSHELLGEPGQNPVLVGWRRLLEYGFPFLKREILRDPDVAPAGRSAPRMVTRLFGVDVAEWVEDLVA
ncbi:MAG: rhamnan synthesis F family protein [Acidimicrobiales bacterium]